MMGDPKVGSDQQFQMAQVEMDLGGREYRKGNWTLHETVALIAAKKLDDERRMKGGDKEKNKPAELRWKWVENYCWQNGCRRSQNQCNDKWDNLLRDYKKVRDYELLHLNSSTATGAPTNSNSNTNTNTNAITANGSTNNNQSYWQLEKHERKEKGLPSNLLYQVYEALHEIVDKRYPPRIPHPHPNPLPLPLPLASDYKPGIPVSSAQLLPAPAPPSMALLPAPPLQPPPQLLQLQQQQQQNHYQIQQQQQQQLQPQPQPQPQPQQPSQPQLQPQQHHALQPTSMPGLNMTPSIKPPLPSPVARFGERSDHESSGSEGDDAVPSSPAAKRQKMVKKSNSSRDVTHNLNLNLSSAIEKSTIELTQTILACEEKKDKRHRDILGIEEKKLNIEATKTELSRKGIAGLINALNNLANAILALASEKNVTTSD